MVLGPSLIGGLAKGRSRHSKGRALKDCRPSLVSLELRNSRVNKGALISKHFMGRLEVLLELELEVLVVVVIISVPTLPL